MAACRGRLSTSNLLYSQKFFCKTFYKIKELLLTLQNADLVHEYDITERYFMSPLFVIFILLQLILFFLMTFHDWVHLPPLTDIAELEKHSSFWGRVLNSVIFALWIIITLVLTVQYAPELPTWVMVVLITFYGLLTLGTLFSWWLPYFFGSSAAHKKAFIEYKNTHHFLPARGDNVVPNTFHVILHLIIWTCFGIALSMYILRA